MPLGRQPSRQPNAVVAAVDGGLKGYDRRASRRTRRDLDADAAGQRAEDTDNDGERTGGAAAKRGNLLPPAGVDNDQPASPRPARRRPVTAVACTAMLKRPRSRAVRKARRGQERA